MKGLHTPVNPPHGSLGTALILRGCKYKCTQHRHILNRELSTHLAFLHLLLEKAVQKQVAEVWAFVKRLLDVTKEDAAITSQQW